MIFLKLSIMPVLLSTILENNIKTWSWNLAFEEEVPNFEEDTWGIISTSSIPELTSVSWADVVTCFVTAMD
jgi:hypothetical protein